MKWLVLVAFVWITAGVSITHSHDMSRNLEVLEKFLEGELRGLDLRSMRDKKSIDVSDVESDIEESGMFELSNSLQWLDTDLAVDQAVKVLANWGVYEGASGYCTDIMFIIGSLPYMTREQFTPMHIKILAKVTQTLIGGGASQTEMNTALEAVTAVMTDIYSEMEETGEDVLKTMGAVPNSDVSIVTEAIDKTVRSGTFRMTGKSLVAGVVTAVINALHRTQLVDVTSCDINLARQWLSQTSSKVLEILRNEDIIEDRALAAAVHSVIVEVIGQSETEVALIEMANITPVPRVDIGTALTKVAWRNLFAIAKARVEGLKKLDKLMYKAGISLPVTTPVEDVAITDVVMLGIAATDNMPSVFGFTCELSGLASMIAGLLEMQQMTFTVRRPVSHRLALIRDVVSELNSVGSIDVEDVVADEWAKVLATIYTDVLAPAAIRIDTDLNKGHVYASRMLPLLLFATYQVSEPNTLADILLSSILPIVEAFKQDQICPQPPTVNDINGVLAETFTKMDSKARALAVTMATNLGNRLNLDSADVTGLSRVLVDVTKVMITELGTELLDILTELSIEPTLHVLRNMLGWKLGEDMYNEIWYHRLTAAAGPSI